MDHVHRDFRTPLAQGRPPACDVVLVEEVRHFRPETAGLHQGRRDDAVRGPPQQVVDHRPADTEANNPALFDAQVVQQPKLVVGVSIPGAVYLQWPGGLAAVGIAKVCGDNAEVVPVGIHGVEGHRRIQRGNAGIESAARNDHQWKSRTGFFVVDTGGASFVERHGVSPLSVNGKADLISSETAGNCDAISECVVFYGIILRLSVPRMTPVSARNLIC